MEQVFILFALSSSEETTVIRVFSSYKSARFFKEVLEVSLDQRHSFHIKDNDRLFIDFYDVWK